MQFIIAILALAATAVAAPSSDSWSCTFGQYACSLDGSSIKQCNISGKWVTVGPCPDGTSCADSTDNGLPYCFADADSSYDKKVKAKRGKDVHCTTPGTYSCSWDDLGINVCDSENKLEFNGACPAGTHCELLASANWIPFCVDNTYY